jgi:hypothetical protein
MANNYFETYEILIRILYKIHQPFYGISNSAISTPGSFIAQRGFGLPSSASEELFLKELFSLFSFYSIASSKFTLESINRGNT